MNIERIQLPELKKRDIEQKRELKQQNKELTSNIKEIQRINENNLNTTLPRSVIKRYEAQFNHNHSHNAVKKNNNFFCNSFNNFFIFPTKFIAYE